MKIQDETIDRTIIELSRTLSALNALRAKRKKVVEPVTIPGYATFPGVRPTETKEHAALKRASMDLTRKLADLRAGR